MANYIMDENGNISLASKNKSNNNSKSNNKKKKKGNAYFMDENGNISLIREGDKDEDIAPVKNTKIDTVEKEKERTWFQAGAFEDGYQFGDLSKSVFGTINDVAAGVAEGVVRSGEGILDAGAYGVAWGADLVGADSFADDVRKVAQKDDTGELFKQVRGNLPNIENSLLGERSKGVTNALGQILTTIATGGAGAAAGLGKLGTTALTTAFQGVSSAGLGTSEAYAGGATDEEAALYGITKGAIDATSELIFGGLGKAVNATGLSHGLSSLDDQAAKALSDTITRKITSETIKRAVGNTAEFAVKSSAEGLEEVIAGVGTAVAKKFTYMEEEELLTLLNDENLLEQFIVGAVTSGIAQTPGYVSSIKTDTDFVTGRTTNEQTVFDKEVESRITEEQADGTKLTNKLKQKIEEQVERDMERGFISTDTIEEVLGGDTYKAYKSTVDTEDALKREEASAREEFNKLNRMKQGEMTGEQRDRLEELRVQLTDITSKIEEAKKNSQREQLKEKLSEEVSSKVMGDRLYESYNEVERRKQAFEADLTKYSDAQRKVVEAAVNSGILNNTNRTHEFVDIVSKISADKGVPFGFTNNAKLKESGFALDGEITNGFISKDGVTLNMSSSKAWQATVGHEITHVLEGTEVYDTLQKMLFDYAKTKGEYDSRLEAVTKLYQKYDPTADPKKELTADLVGDYLFNDTDFINNLSVNHRNIFQKIYDEIKYLAKVVTAGSKEAKQIEKIKHAFEKAYRAQKNTAADSGTRYHVSSTFSEEIDKTLNNEMPKSSTVSKNLTPEQEEYFKDSVVRDEDGNLKVMYHGTSAGGHTVFDPYGKARYGLFGAGSYFTDNKEIAESYTKKGKGTNPQVYETYLNIKNPIDMDAQADPEAWAAAMPEVDFPESGTNESFYRAMEEYFEDAEYPRWEAAETAMGVIEDMGFDGITHIGGGRVNADGVRHRVYIAFQPEQIKNIDNVKPTSDPDIRFSLSEQDIKETNEKLGEVDLQYDKKSETVSFSLSSLEDTFQYKTDNNGLLVTENDYTKAREEYADALVKTTGKTREEANRYLDSLFLIHDMIALDRDRLDYEAAVNKSAWVSNAEYGGSIDFSTLCAKRRLFTGTFDAIQNALPDTVLNENDFLRIRDMLVKKEKEAPCSMCYVEGSRAKHGEYVSKWLREYLKTEPEWKPQIADFTSTTRLEQTRIRHPEAYAAYTKAMNSLAQRKPKEASVRTDYKGEILRDFRDSSTIAEKNKNGGVRFNSFSDFEIIHALDAMQVITDMARVGLNGQAYTKVKEFAESFGNTGLKINLSLVAKDVDADGKLVFDEKNGMNYSEAMDIRNRYSDNVGSVLVVFNDAQLKAALADSTIDYVLPFHRSQWKKSQYAMMGLPGQTKDYTMVQNDRATNPKTGKPAKLSKLKRTTTYTNDVTGETFEIKDNIMPNQYWDFSKSGRENAQRYLDYINANRMTPKFDSVLEKVDGKWVLPGGAVGDGYFKLLIDFKMYNNDGWGSPQKPVLPEFNMPYIQNMLDNYIGGHQSFPVAYDVVDEFVAGKKKGAFSLSDTSAAQTRRGTPLRDLMLEKDIAPVAEEVKADVPEANDANISNIDYAPYSEAEANALRDENFARVGDADATPETDAPYYGDETEAAVPDDPFENRDMKDVGNRKVKAYMYENPEVKPFFQSEANIMLGELENTTKGERMYLEGDFDGYGAESNYRYVGITRHTSDDIAYLKDELGLTYEEIRKGLENIIKDDGLENNAASKRIEFLLNDRLLNGYVDFQTGIEIPADQNYIRLLNEKQIVEYNEEARARLFEDIDAYAPPAMEDIAPVREDYEAIRPRRNAAEAMEKDEIVAPVYGDKLVRVDSNNGRPGEKQRKWIGTSTGSEAVDGKVLPDDLDQDTIHYQPIPNKETLGKANEKLGRMGYDTAVAYFNSQFENKQIALEDIALGERLIQEAVKRGDTKTAGELIQNVALLGTELGQKVQALSIIKRLTPEGQLGLLRKTIERGKTKGDKTFEGVELTQDMIDRILDAYGKDGTYDQDKLNRAVEDVKQQIADQMKVTTLEKVNAWRYLAMLGNPKTHIRNLVSNIAMRGTVAVKNTVARTIESIAPIGNRTKTWSAPTKDVKAFAKSTAAEMKDVLSDDGKYSEATSIKDKRQIFKNRVLNAVYEFNSNLLSKEDWWFSKPAFENSLSEFLAANGIRTEADIQNNPELVEKAKLYATDQSQIATFRQFSFLAYKINELEHKNTAWNVAVGSILPFKKTPINIAKAGLNYSPIGFLKTLTYDASRVKNGKMEASEMIDHLAQNITGTALTLLGYMLASAGFLSGGGEDDKEGKYDYQLGEQAYSVNIGGTSYSLSWLSPTAMPLFVGANAYEQLVEGKEWNGDVVVETLAQTLDPLNEMSFLSGLTSVLSSYDSGMQKFAGIGETMVQNYATQFVPTAVSQVATVMDDTKRTTKVSGDSDSKFVDGLINKLKYKIPGLRETLEPSTDIWGNEVKQTEDVLTRAFETFLAPYSKRDNIATDIDAEIKNLYSETGDGGVIPSTPSNYVNYGGEKYEMSGKEYTTFKNTYGQTAYNLLRELMNTSIYKESGADVRADMVNKVYDYARDEAKRAFFADRGMTFTNSTADGEDYYREDSIKGAIENNMTPEEFSYWQENPEKYAFLKENNVSYADYQAFDDDTKEAWSWAYNNPDGYTLSKAAASDVVTYRRYASELYDIKADKDENGKSISGSRKEKVIDYINNLDADYGEKIILYKNEYNADDTYNNDIIDYLNSREDISYEEMVTILKKLGFTVSADGNVSW